MAREAKSFVQAVMMQGFTFDEGKAAAEMIVQWEQKRVPAYPCTMPMILGTAHCSLTADLDGSGALVLKALARV